MTGFSGRKSTVKSVRQQKRKIVEVGRKQDEGPAKKSANITGRGYHEATESIGITKLQPPAQLQIPSAKIKLQLFPINESTRLGLEEHGYNPFLELTLSAQKKISSVVRHLNAKWSCSTIARGQLMLSPYSTKSEALDTCQKWTINDNAITAEEVYVAAESPSLFRLRYGWYSNIQHSTNERTPTFNGFEAHTDSEGKISLCSRFMDIRNQQEAKIVEDSEDVQNLINVSEVSDPVVNEMKVVDAMEDRMDDEVTTDVPAQPTILWDDTFTNLSIGDLLSEISLQGNIKDSDLNSINKCIMQPIGLLSDISVGALLSEASLQSKISNSGVKLETESTLQPIVLTSGERNGKLLCDVSPHTDESKLDGQTIERKHTKSQSPWDDCFTTLSIGGLLSEVSLLRKAGCEPKENESGLQHGAPLSDSFDAFVTAQLCQSSELQNPSCDKSTLSILDAEETCHGFPIQKLRPWNITDVTSSERASPGGCYVDTSGRPFWSPNVGKEKNETVFFKESSCQEQNPLTCSGNEFD
ncbi:uncharacterized protein [Primulina eburnea]|uniref:uncharacterized protein n=1 Tax=Primulina eburnea TaxID=1245227 RepID=UPI003C6BDE72